MASHIGRRKFLATLGGAAAAWPLAARAQQPTLPLVGFLGASSFEASAGRSLLWFKKGLGETGYVEDRNVRIEYRWADDEYERLPSLAMELVHRRVAVLVAGGSPVALPAKAATSDIPVVFLIGLDPVEIGLVSSLNHPGRVEALQVGVDPLFGNHINELVALATARKIPTIYAWREFTVAGGLMSYGSSVPDAFHQVGVYTGQILKGAKPADLPVHRPTKLRLVLNLKAAKAIGLNVPATVFARADEVIE